MVLWRKLSIFAGVKAKRRELNGTRNCDKKYRELVCCEA